MTADMSVGTRWPLESSMAAVTAELVTAPATAVPGCVANASWAEGERLEDRVPAPFGPPLSVVPKRFPLESSVRAHCGPAPLVPLKLARVVMEVVPWAISNTVPSLLAPPPLRSCRRGCRWRPVSGWPWEIARWCR